MPGNRLLDFTLRHNWLDEFKVGEKTAAVYGMAEIGGDSWSGNVGLRAVETRQTTVVNLPGGQNPITGSAFGPYTPTTYERKYRDYLPSANVKFDVRQDLVVRAGIARTMARPDYSALGGSVSLNDDALSGSGGNVKLDPIRSVNYDLSAEWYYMPKAMLSAGLFYMDFSSIVAQGTSTGSYYNNKRGAFTDYQITSPYNTTATNKGIELSWQQPLWNNFGMLTNYTWADGELDGGGEMLNASKNTYNVTGYYENDRFSARLAYSHRSAYKAGVDRGASQHVINVTSDTERSQYQRRPAVRQPLDKPARVPQRFTVGRRDASGHHMRPVQRIHVLQFGQQACPPPPASRNGPPTIRRVDQPGMHHRCDPGRFQSGPVL